MFIEYRFWAHAHRSHTHGVVRHAKIGTMEALDLVTRDYGWRWALHANNREIITIKEIGTHHWPVETFANNGDEMRVICREESALTPRVYVGFIWRKADAVVYEFEMGVVAAQVYGVI